MSVDTSKIIGYKTCLQTINNTIKTQKCVIFREDDITNAVDNGEAVLEDFISYCNPEKVRVIVDGTTLTLYDGGVGADVERKEYFLIRIKGADKSENIEDIIQDMTSKKDIRDLAGLIRYLEHHVNFLGYLIVYDLKNLLGSKSPRHIVNNTIWEVPNITGVRYMNGLKAIFKSMDYMSITGLSSKNGQEYYKSYQLWHPMVTVRRKFK